MGEELQNASHEITEEMIAAGARELAHYLEYTFDGPIPYGEDFLVRVVCNAMADANPAFPRLASASSQAL